MAALNETHRQKHVTDETCDQFSVLVWLVQIEPIDRVRIVEYQPGKLKGYAMRAIIPLRFPIVPFEFIVAHFIILVCRTSSKAQVEPAGFKHPLPQRTRPCRPGYRGERLALHIGGAECHLEREIRTCAVPPPRTPPSTE
jgi:hypothetical protein